MAKQALALIRNVPLSCNIADMYQLVGASVGNAPARMELTAATPLSKECWIQYPAVWDVRMLLTVMLDRIAHAAFTHSLALLF